ncbi:MAG: hypothetical protein J6T73_04010, partial [Clostridia bacterium]|nr:hypothetical protein [Clostridia bacterium]
MNKFHYIGYCYSENEKNEYKCNVASNIKMHYIASAAQRAEYRVSLLSMCKPNKKTFSPFRTDKSGDIPVKHIAAFRDSNRFINALSLALYEIQLLLYIVFSVRKKDTVLIYHSMRLSGIVSKIMRFRKCHYILEVEELYSFAADGIKTYHEKEKRIINAFDHFLFANGYIPKYLGIPQEKFVTVYGSYLLPESWGEKYNDGKIHCLYAGAVEKLNKGAFRAIEASELLPDNYVLHLIGKGSKQDLEEATELIKAINDRSGYEKIVYDGFYSGAELDEYMSRCDIGIGTYAIQDSYSNFIFPSKLVSYMCHNLKVVTGKSECYIDIPISV